MSCVLGDREEDERGYKLHLSASTNLAIYGSLLNVAI